MSHLQPSDLLPVGTRVRVGATTGFAAGAFGVIDKHNLLPASLGIGPVHTLCYTVRFDVPQRGEDDEFGTNYTPPGGFTTGVFRFSEVEQVPANAGKPGFDTLSGEPMTEKELRHNRMSNPV